MLKSQIGIHEPVTVDFENIHNNFIKSDEYLRSGNLKDYVETKYKNCDSFVCEWILEDLTSKIDHHSNLPQENKNGNLNLNLIRNLHDDLKYEIIQFIPTYNNSAIMEGYLLDEAFRDTQLITLHKMRIISKTFNKIMMQRILTLSHMEINLSRPLTKKHFYNLLNAQSEYQFQKPIAIELGLLLINNQLKEKLNINEAFAFGGNIGFGFGSGFSFGGTPTFESTHSSLLMVKPELRDYRKEFFNIPKKSDDKKVYYQKINSNITLKSLIIEDGVNEFISLPAICKGLRKLCMVSNYSNFEWHEIGSLEEIGVFDSLEELHFCSLASLSHGIRNEIFHNLTPKLKLITTTNCMENLYDSLRNSRAEIMSKMKKMNIFKREGCVNSLIDSFDNSSRDFGRELDIVIRPSSCNRIIFKELEDLFGNSFIRKVLLLFLFSYSTEPLSDTSKSKFRDLSDYIFKERGISIQYLDLLSQVVDFHVEQYMIQYISYLCNEYQESQLFVTNLMRNRHLHLKFDTFPMAHNILMRFINYGWDFRNSRAMDSLLQLCTNVNATISILDNFTVDSGILLRILRKYCIGAIEKAEKVEERLPLVNIFICHLLSHNARQLCQYLVEEKIHFTLDSKPCSIPLLAALFSSRTSHFLIEIIKEMDQDIFEKLSVNERGDSILHLFLYLRDYSNYCFDYTLLCELVKKNPNLLNLANNKGQTPLQLMMLTEPTAKLVVKEIKRSIKDAKINF